MQCALCSFLCSVCSLCKLGHGALTVVLLALYNSVFSAGVGQGVYSPQSGLHFGGETQLVLQGCFFLNYSCKKSQIKYSVLAWGNSTTHHSQMLNYQTIYAVSVK